MTFTVEKRDRFPVRIRYARANREDEESIRRLLISPSGMATAAGGELPHGVMSPACIQTAPPNASSATTRRPERTRRFSGPCRQRQAADSARAQWPTLRSSKARR